MTTTLSNDYLDRIETSANKGIPSEMTGFIENEDEKEKRLERRKLHIEQITEIFHDLEHPKFTPLEMFMMFRMKVDEGLGQNEIAELFQTSRQTVQRIMQKIHDISGREGR